MPLIRSRFILSSIVAVILLGLLIFFHASAPVRFMQGKIVDILHPALYALTRLRIQVTTGINESIDERRRRAAAEAALQDIIQENNRLRSALGLQQRSKRKLSGASVLYYGRELGNEFLLIDNTNAGHTRQGDLVVDTDGTVIGTVRDIEDSIIRVDVVSNPGTIIDAQILPWGGSAFAKGFGGRSFSLELLPQNAVIRVGDYVLTRAGDSSFPFGEVVRVDTAGTGAFKEVRAVLIGRPERLQEVFIVPTVSK